MTASAAYRQSQSTRPALAQYRRHIGSPPDRMHSVAGVTVPGVVTKLGASKVREMILATAFVRPEGRTVLDTLPGLGGLLSRNSPTEIGRRTRRRVCSPRACMRTECRTHRGNSRSTGSIRSRRASFSRTSPRGSHVPHRAGGAAVAASASCPVVPRADTPADRTCRPRTVAGHGGAFKPYLHERFNIATLTPRG